MKEGCDVEMNSGSIQRFNALRWFLLNRINGTVYYTLKKLCDLRSVQIIRSLAAPDIFQEQNGLEASVGARSLFPLFPLASTLSFQCKLQFHRMG